MPSMFAAVAVHLSCKRLSVRHRASWSRVGDRFDVRHYSSCFVVWCVVCSVKSMVYNILEPISVGDCHLTTVPDSPDFWYHNGCPYFLSMYCSVDHDRRVNLVHSHNTLVYAKRHELIQILVDALIWLQ